MESALAAYPLGRIPYSDVLNAFSRRTDAEIDYFRAVVNYQRAIVQVHLRKGSLLDYDQVVFAECPWPGLAPHVDARGPLRRKIGHLIDHMLSRAGKPSITACGEAQTPRPTKDQGRDSATHPSPGPRE